LFGKNHIPNNIKQRRQNHRAKQMLPFFIECHFLIETQCQRTKYRAKQNEKICEVEIQNLKVESNN
jgi:hypothetical protein